MEKDDFFERFGNMVGKGARSIRDRFTMDVTDLIRAVDKNNPDDVDRALRAGIDPDIRDALGRRALTMAVDNNSAAIVRLILKAGANPNLPGRDGQTPLSKAVFWESATVAKLLISAGADPDLSLNNSKTPMEAANEGGLTKLMAVMEAQRKQRRDSQVERDRARHEELKQRASDARAQREKEERMATEAAAKRTAAAAAQEKAKAEQDAHRNYKDKEEDNFTAFVRAIRQKDTTAAKIFLEKMLDLNAIHPELKTTPLLEAIREEDSQIIRYLIDKDADMIHPVAGTEHSPLSMAVKKKAYKLVKLILEKNEHEVAEVLNNPDQLMSLQYFAYQDARMLNLLLGAGADPFFGGKGLPSPISRAIEKASIAILPVLVKNKVDLSKNVDHKTPLEWAIQHNKLAWVIGLLAEGADKTKVNEAGVTPLEYAKELGADEAILGALG